MSHNHAWRMNVPVPEYPSDSSYSEDDDDGNCDDINENRPQQDYQQLFLEETLFLYPMCAESILKGVTGHL